ncbi:MAG TPA: ABC transporter permease [Bryobacteraceae bacterium]|nr:ABC transporter permease [Bryobacteraceae bacterium]
MKTLRRMWRRLAGSFSGWRGENELADELASHIEMQVEDNLRAGMPPEEARRAARLKFGNVTLAAESYRGQRGLPWLEALFTDLRYALRGLCKSPGFTVLVVLTLALGIGAITAVFSLVNQVLLAPPGIRNPERIVTILTRYRKLNVEFQIASPQILADLHQSSQAFERAALMAQEDANYTAGGDPQRLHGAVVTAEWFDVFGAKPFLGRVFRKEEDQPNANRVVVLSYAAWVRLFGADPSVPGRTIELNQVPRRIVGVMPPEFRWPQNVDVWTPAGLAASDLAPTARFGNEHYMAVARTKPDVSFQRAKEWMAILSDRIRNTTGPVGVIAKDYGWSVSAASFTETVAGETRKPLLVLFGAVAFVLLIVCSNVAGLLLARASARSREFAVRAALGASRGQLLRALLAESLLLVVAGGAAGLTLASNGINLLLRLAPQDVVAGLDPHMDLRVLLFCATTALASAVLFGFAPAWQISRIDPSGGLKNDDRASTAAHGRQRLRSILVVVETALALMLLVAGGLFLRSFARLAGVNPGFEPRGVMTAMCWLPQQTYMSERQVQVFDRAVLDRLSNTEGVAAAALGSTIPFSSLWDSAVFQIEGRAPAPGEPMPYGDVVLVTPDYFRTLGIPIERGRTFADADRAGSESVAVIDENLARRYWPGEDPVGKRIGRGEWHRIIGVVGHVTKSNLAADRGNGVYYFSMFQHATPLVTILAKARGDASDVPAAIREAVRDADPRQAVHSFRSMPDLVADSLAPRRFGMRLLAFFAATALFLAALGLYGVIAYSVTQRTREIGIRIALGAERAAVLQLVVGHGLRLAALGAGIGVAGALAAARLIQSQLFEVSAADPLTIAAMAAVLLAIATLASYLPARQALRVDPAVALRPE